MDASLQRPARAHPSPSPFCKCSAGSKFIKPHALDGYIRSLPFRVKAAHGRNPLTFKAPLQCCQKSWAPVRCDFCAQGLRAQCSGGHRPMPRTGPVHIPICRRRVVCKMSSKAASKSIARTPRTTAFRWRWHRRSCAEPPLDNLELKPRSPSA